MMKREKGMWETPVAKIIDIGSTQSGTLTTKETETYFGIS